MAIVRSHHSLRLLVIVLGALVAAESAYLAYPAVRDLLAPPYASRAQHGRELAAQLGCFSCHGPGGRGGVPNPGSETKQVPSFREGTIMMYAHDDQELREYILDGAPAKKLAQTSYRAAQAKQMLRMPAFRDFVGDADVAALVAYLRAASGLLVPADEPAARGADLALTYGCFECHGEMGAGGVPNPGSLKGYIPGFGGADYEELVRGDGELRAWIADGGVARLRDDQLASFFLQRQRIQMPAFKDRLSTGDVDALVAYVRWLASGRWQQLPLTD
jgi:mono/diheme cytochrome c family protein